MSDAASIVVDMPSGFTFVQAGAGAVARTAQSKLRDVVSVADYGATGDGVTNDMAAILLAIATGKDLYFPRGTYKISAAIAPVSNQTWYADNNATISGNFADFLIKPVGFTSANLTTATTVISALTWTVVLTDASGLVAGDMFSLADSGTSEIEVNIVQQKVGNTIYTRWPIMQPFATPANVLVYKLFPIANFHVRGIGLANAHASGGLYSATYTQDCSIDGCTLGPCGYIGVTFQVSTNPRITRNKVRRAGGGGSVGSGVGFRVTHGGAIVDNDFQDQQADESITLYKNNSHTTITGNRITQQLSGMGTGSAGNSILVDTRNCYNVINGNTMDGSATIAIYLTNGSSYNTVTGNTINRVTVGGIKVDGSSNGNLIDANILANVTSATDPFEGGAASAAIRVKSDSAENRIGQGNVFNSVAGLTVVNAQTTGATSLQYAMAKKSADQTGANYTPPGVVAWNSEVADTSSIHDNVTNNSRLTVPSNANVVEVGCTLALSLVASAAIIAVALKKNGSTTFDGAAGYDNTVAGNPDQTISITSGPLAVAMGDYFEWQLYCDDASITIVAARSNAWMKVIN